MRRFPIRVLIGMLAALLLLGIAGVVWASQGDVACVVSIQPFRPGQPVPPIGSPRCFSTLEEALKGLRLVPVLRTSSPSDPSGDRPAVPELPYGSGSHCVIEIKPLRPGERFSEIRPIGCFDSFAEAISAATGGALHLPPDWDAANGLPDQPAPSQNRIVIGIDYDGPNFTGSTLVWETDHTPGCSDGTSFIAPSMPTGWNDRVSSARSYSGCNHYYHYEHVNFGGSVLDCGGGCASMGVMDNQTSSEKWTP